MEHCAIDLGGRESQVCVRDAEGHVLLDAARSLKLWAAEITRRRGRLIATVALARKLAVICYALWRDGTTYQVRH
jgi:hypothetical protein